MALLAYLLYFVIYDKWTVQYEESILVQRFWDLNDRYQGKL